MSGFGGFLSGVASFLGGPGGVILGGITNLYQARTVRTSGDSAYQAAERNANIIRFNTSNQLRALKVQSRWLAGTQRARFAASGVRARTGTPLHVAMDTARRTIEEADIIQTGGELSAAAAIYEGAQLRTAAGYQASDILIRGVGDILDNWS